MTGSDSRLSGEVAVGLDLMGAGPEICPCVGHVLPNVKLMMKLTESSIDSDVKEAPRSVLRRRCHHINAGNLKFNNTEKCAKQLMLNLKLKLFIMDEK